MEVFDEDKAVAYILERLGADSNVKTKYSGDDILEVIDIIWDYYEDNGFLDIDMSVDESEDDKAAMPEKARLIDHVTKMIRKDKGSAIQEADIPAIVDAELDFEALCDTL